MLLVNPKMADAKLRSEGANGKNSNGNVPSRSSSTLRPVWTRHEAAALAESCVAENLDAYADHLRDAMKEALVAFVAMQKAKKE